MKIKRTSHIPIAILALGLCSLTLTSFSTLAFAAQLKNNSRNSSNQVVDGIQDFVQKITTSPYTTPAPSEQDLFRQGLTDWINGRTSKGKVTLQKVGYSITTWTYPSGDVTAFIPSPQAHANGLFLLNLPAGDSGTALIFEAPHPIDDLGTPLLAARIFENLKGSALAIAGSERCSSQVNSSCDGETSVCAGHPEPFRVSDIAHNVESNFQIFHEVLFNHWADSVAIQIHGFSAAARSAAYVVSDGTTDDRPRKYVTNDFARLLSQSLKSLSVHSQGISCNNHPSEVDLCATTNIQGRFSNLNKKLCNEENTALNLASGRFVHLELSPSLRAPDNLDAVRVITDAFKKSVVSK